MGFTIIEVLTIMGILAILGTIGAPDLTSWYGKQRAIDQASTIHEMVDTARTNALSEKKCINDVPSKSWRVTVSSVLQDRKFSLHCTDINDQSQQEEPIQINDTNYKFNDDFLAQANFFQNYNDSGFTTSTGNLEIEFRSGEFETRVFGDGTEQDILRIDIVARSDSSLIRRLCIDRQKNYSYFSETTDCLEFFEDEIHNSTATPPPPPSGPAECTNASQIDDRCGGGIFAGFNVVMTETDQPSAIWVNAISYCDGLIQDGYSDWYLPDIDVLSTFYSNRNELSTSFDERFYWTSDEASSSRANAGRFSDGRIRCPGKNSPRGVRCARNPIL